MSPLARIVDAIFRSTGAYYGMESHEEVEVVFKFPGSAAHFEFEVIVWSEGIQIAAYYGSDDDVREEVNLSDPDAIAKLTEKVTTRYSGDRK